MNAFDILEIQDQDLGFAKITNGKMEFTFKNGIVASSDWNSRIMHPYRMLEVDGNMWVCFYDSGGLVFDDNFTMVGGFLRYGNWASPGLSQYIYDFAVDNNAIYAVSYNLRRVGAFVRGGDSEIWKMSYAENPYSITLLPNGNVAVAFYNGGTGGRGHIDEIDAATGATVRVLLDSTVGQSVPWSGGASNPSYIRHIVRDGRNEVWVSHYTAGVIAIYNWDDTAGLELSEIIGEHNPIEMTSSGAYSFTYDSDRNYIYLATAVRKIYTIDMETKDVIGEFGVPILDVSTDTKYAVDAIYAPWGILYYKGKVVISDYSNQRIMAFHPDVIVRREVSIQYSVPTNNYITITVKPDRYDESSSTMKYLASELLTETPPDKIVIAGIIQDRRR